LSAAGFSQVTTAVIHTFKFEKIVSQQKFYLPTQRLRACHVGEKRPDVRPFSFTHKKPPINNIVISSRDIESEHL
jgi:hypothetical protein